MEFLKLKSSLTTYFLLRAVIKLLWRNFCFYKFFQKIEKNNTLPDTEVFKVNKVYRQKAQKGQKSKNPVFQKNR